MRREPEVPEEKSLSGRMSRWPCKDYLRRTCNNSFCGKWHPPECLFYKTKRGCRFGEKCSFAHRQVDEQPTKRSKKNDDKSAVAMLKKGDWHESVREPVINYGHDRSRRSDKKRDHELERGPTGRRTSNARQLGCIFQDMTPPKSILRKCTDTLEFDTKILRSDMFAQVNLMSVAPTLQNLRIGPRRRQNGKSKVPAKQRGSRPKVC